jgi:hypothetical protein
MMGVHLIGDKMVLRQEDVSSAEKLGWTTEKVRSLGGRYYKKTGQCRIPSSRFWEAIHEEGIRSMVISNDTVDHQDQPVPVEWILYLSKKEDDIPPPKPQEEAVVVDLGALVELGPDVVDDEKSCLSTNNSSCSIATQTDTDESVEPSDVGTQTFFPCQYEVPAPPSLHALALSLMA